jgi:hypothetical protein
LRAEATKQTGLCVVSFREREELLSAATVKIDPLGWLPHPKSWRSDAPAPSLGDCDDQFSMELMNQLQFPKLALDADYAIHNRVPPY